jgi:hypothetical protein
MAFFGIHLRGMGVVLMLEFVTKVKNAKLAR